MSVIYEKRVMALELEVKQLNRRVRFLEGFVLELTGRVNAHLDRLDAQVKEKANEPK